MQRRTPRRSAPPRLRLAFPLTLLAAFAGLAAYGAFDDSSRRSSAQFRPDSSRATAPFANCTAARAAGRENIRAGDPAYGPWLDRDKDGLGCEPYQTR